jgi:hypothetical protein
MSSADPPYAGSTLSAPDVVIAIESVEIGFPLVAFDELADAAGPTRRANVRTKLDVTIAFRDLIPTPRMGAARREWTRTPWLTAHFLRAVPVWA